MVKTHLGQGTIIFSTLAEPKREVQFKNHHYYRRGAKTTTTKEVKASDPKIQKFPQVYQVLVVECITHVASRYGICSYMYGLFL